MAAYAALASLLTVIDQLQQHTFPPVSLDEQQLESLTKNASFLQEFLAGYNSPFEEEADPLESRIADVACAIKAAIESYIAHVILLRLSNSGEEISCYEETDYEEEISSDDETDFQEETGSDEESKYREEIGGDDETKSREEVGSGEVIAFGKTRIPVKKLDLGEEINCINFYQDLHQVMEEMHFIKKEVMGISVKEKLSFAVQNKVKINVPTQRSSVVGFDDITYEIMDKLIGGRPSRHVIPITGMGGIGKTTLAKYIYEKPLIKYHFDICAWATISQQYSIEETLCELLSQAKKESKEELSKMSKDEVGLARTL